MTNIPYDAGTVLKTSLSTHKIENNLILSQKGMMHFKLSLSSCLHLVHMLKYLHINLYSIDQIVFFLSSVSFLNDDSSIDILQCIAMREIAAKTIL